VPGGFIKLILQTTAHDCDRTFVESHATELAKLTPKQLVELIEAKLVTESERHASRGTEPSSPMADVLFRLLNLMWTGEMVPQYVGNRHGWFKYQRKAMLRSYGQLSRNLVD
jgi:hypothetical protein